MRRNDQPLLLPVIDSTSLDDIKVTGVYHVTNPESTLIHTEMETISPFQYTYVSPANQVIVHRHTGETYSRRRKPHNDEWEEWTKWENRAQK